ncbi:MAG: hypothetical protein H3Z54_09975 [archaeon]|nr:hypothetical protein [archaeon]
MTLEKPKLEAKAPWKGIFEFASIGIAAVIGVLIILSFFPGNIGESAYNLLNSNFILTLIAAVVAPWIAKTAKDKVGLDITSKEIEELLEAVRKAAELTRRDYDKMRDDYGRIGEHGKEAKNQAIERIKGILGEEKYSKIIKKVGSQFLDKAIDEYVASEWHERFPIEKEQVKDLISIAVDSVPKAKIWKELAAEEKEKIIGECFTSLNTLLEGAGIQGWGKDVLLVYIKAELNK